VGVTLGWTAFSNIVNPLIQKLLFVNNPDFLSHWKKPLKSIIFARKSLWLERHSRAKFTNNVAKNFMAVYGVCMLMCKAYLLIWTLNLCNSVSVVAIKFILIMNDHSSTFYISDHYSTFYISQSWYLTLTDIYSRLWFWVILMLNNLFIK
jgi:hypothetical protein